MEQINLEQLKNLINITSQKLGIQPSMVEKDYYVFLVLDYLFCKSKWKDHLFFKGGTALSKCFNLIDRFSEDIDLVIGWSLIDIDLNEANRDRGSKSHKTFDKKWKHNLLNFIKNNFAPELKKQMQNIYKNIFNVQIEKDENNISVNLIYPAIYQNKAIKQFIKIELGPRSIIHLSEKHKIKPYISDLLPNSSIKESSVTTISTNVIFWEKIAILHEIAFLNKISKNYLYSSRHYYDVYCLYHSKIKQNALNNKDLLINISKFRKNFFRTNKTCMDAFTSRKIVLIPNKDVLKLIEKDYALMQDMIYKNPPPFKSIIKILRLLQKEINS